MSNHVPTSGPPAWIDPFPDPDPDTGDDDSESVDEPIDATTEGVAEVADTRPAMFVSAHEHDVRSMC